MRIGRVGGGPCVLCGGGGGRVKSVVDLQTLPQGSRQVDGSDGFALELMCSNAVVCAKCDVA